MLPAERACRVRLDKEKPGKELQALGAVAVCYMLWLQAFPIQTPTWRDDHGFG